MYIICHQYSVANFVTPKCIHCHRTGKLVEPTKPICICRYYIAELLLPLIAFLLPLIAAAIN